ncbi:MAG: methyltransferase domain-containing protein [Proteobacteria bacterium]|nr:methyltransferase domain-containing protein [Pseudomonadota bacterium]
MKAMDPVLSRQGPLIRILNFWRLSLRRPRSIGAVAPSSEALATAIAEQVDFDTPGVIVELGGGTGSITAALVERATDQQDIVVIEREKSLCALLSARYPGVRVVCGDAQYLGRLLRDENIVMVKAVVSGLPLLTMPGRARLKMIRQAFAALAPGGVFVQFTYGFAAPVPRSVAEHTGIVGRRTKWIVRNLPPAALWLYQRHGVPDATPLSAGEESSFPQ